MAGMLQIGAIEPQDPTKVVGPQPVGSTPGVATTAQPVQSVTQQPTSSSSPTTQPAQTTSPAASSSATSPAASSWSGDYASWSPAQQQQAQSYLSTNLASGNYSGIADQARNLGISDSSLLSALNATGTGTYSQSQIDQVRSGMLGSAAAQPSAAQTPSASAGAASAAAASPAPGGITGSFSSGGGWSASPSQNASPQAGYLSAASAHPAWGSYAGWTPEQKQQAYQYYSDATKSGDINGVIQKAREFGMSDSDLLGFISDYHKNYAAPNVNSGASQSYLDQSHINAYDMANNPLYRTTAAPPPKTDLSQFAALVTQAVQPDAIQQQIAALQADLQTKQTDPRWASFMSQYGDFEAQNTQRQISQLNMQLGLAQGLQSPQGMAQIIEFARSNNMGEQDLMNYINSHIPLSGQQFTLGNIDQMYAASGARPLPTGQTTFDRPNMTPDSIIASTANLRAKYPDVADQPLHFIQNPDKSYSRVLYAPDGTQSIVPVTTEEKGRLEAQYAAYNAEYQQIAAQRQQYSQDNIGYYGNNVSNQDWLTQSQGGTLAQRSNTPGSVTKESLDAAFAKAGLPPPTAQQYAQAGVAGYFGGAGTQARPTPVTPGTAAAAGAVPTPVMPGTAQAAGVPATGAGGGVAPGARGDKAGQGRAGSPAPGGGVYDGQGRIVGGPAGSYSAQMDPNSMTVEGRLQGLLTQGNPLLDLAMTKAMQSAASRGLLNSSIAAEAGQAAVIQNAMPIAQQDAATYFQNLSQNTGYANQMGQLNAQNQNRLDVTQLQGNIDLQKIGAQGQQSLAQISAQGQNTLADTAARTAGQLQIDAQRATSDAQIAALKGSIDTNLAITNNDASALRQAAQGNTAAYQAYVQQVTAIETNPNLDAAAKTAAKNNLGDGFVAYLRLNGALAGDINLQSVIDQLIPTSSGQLQPAPAPAPAPAPSSPPSGGSSGGEH